MKFILVGDPHELTPPTRPKLPGGRLRIEEWIDHGSSVGRDRLVPIVGLPELLNGPGRGLN
jgi:hypothetical protein